MASFAEWAPINAGIIESNLGVHMATAHGDKLGRMISDYLRENDPTLLFMQLDGPDEGGHTHGYFTQGHYDAIEESDAVLGMVLDAIQREIADAWAEELNQWTRRKAWQPHTSLFYSREVELAPILGAMRAEFEPFSAQIGRIEFSRVDEEDRIETVGIVDLP